MFLSFLYCYLIYNCSSASFHGVVANELVLNKFELQSHNYVYFRIIFPKKNMSSIIRPSISLILLKWFFKNSFVTK